MQKKIGQDARMVHVAYAMTDKQGTYSKYIGTSMYSLFARTDAWVTVHLLHDETLTEQNRDYFIKLARSCGQQMFFYNMAELCQDILQEAREIFKGAVDTDYYTPAALYRILAARVLPKNVKRLIYLDADTIVNMDIRKFWEIFMDNHPIGAVGERDLMNHYQRQVDKSIDEKLYLFKNSWTDSDSCFNSGVLIMDLERLRNMGDILLPGLQFLVQHQDECQFFDQDILNYFFSRDYMHLPWNYNILQHWDRKWGEPELREGIYHYMGRTLRLNFADPRDSVFYEAFVQTPWCNAEYICKSLIVTRDVISGNIHKNNELNRKAAAAWGRRRRVFVGPKENEEKLREMFFLQDVEPYVALEEGWEKTGLHLPYDLSTHVYVFFLDTFPELRKQLEEAGWQEWEDFIDGKALILPRPAHLLDEYRIFMVM